MSMLAEHKSRPSWVLNPRASDWSKDQNKLGQKMLEKMGWSAGKGLGAKEQGPVEAVRVAFKADVRGLGASRKKEQEYWLQQQESFQSLLQNLNGGDEQNVEVKSLEERSKTSKTRVHYHKFTRGKDISRYSKKDLSCIVGSGVAAPKVIPASVVSNSQQLPADDLQSRIGDDVVENSDCGAASALDSKQHSTTEMRLRSERKRTGGETVPAIENPIPAKKKKSKKSSDDNDVLKVKPSNSTVLKPSKPGKSSGDLVADRETNVINESQQRPKRKSARSSKEVETPPIEQVTSVDAEEEVLRSSKKSRIGKKSKKDALHDADDNRIVAVKEGKKKNKAGNPLRDGVAEENVIETEPKKKGRKKKKKELINVDTEGCAVESKPSGRKSKRKMALEQGGKGKEETEEIQSSLADDAKTRKEKKKKNKAKSSEVLVDTEDVLVSESQGTVVSSNILQENEDTETELGSINSQSSLINELLGVEIRNSIDLSSRPESWFKNHILSPDSEDEISSNEESMTGIPKKKKI